MTKTKIAINGFGRIGRLVLKQAMNNELFEVVAVNDLTDNATLAHLFKYDTTHGVFPGAVSADEINIVINGQAIRSLSENDPAALPWGAMGVDIVVECTGRFRKPEDAGLHLKAGAKKVIISAPAKGDVRTIVLGVNDSDLTADDHIVSNASCTTNCLAPMVKVLDDAFGLERGFMTTVHAFTADQRLQDAPHKDLRRARAASCNIIPTTSGAAISVAKVIPHLEGKLKGGAMRVPVINGSITEMTCILSKDVTKEEINKAFETAAASGSLKGIMQYATDPLVSSDIVGNPYSCIYDSQLTDAINNLVRVTGWYDNEFGYASRLVDLAAKMTAFLK